MNKLYVYCINNNDLITDLIVGKKYTIKKLRINRLTLVEIPQTFFINRFILDDGVFLDDYVKTLKKSRSGALYTDKRFKYNFEDKSYFYSFRDNKKLKIKKGEIYQSISFTRKKWLIITLKNINHDKRICLSVEDIKRNFYSMSIQDFLSYNRLEKIKNLKYGKY